MRNRHWPTRTNLLLILATGLLVPGLTLAAGNGKKELETAIEHASFAVKADKLKERHMHLQHAVNCLVGEHGNGFDDSVGNPCRGMGEGAIKDFQTKESVTDMLKHAAGLAYLGTRIETADVDQKVAQAVEMLLKEAKQRSAAKS